MTDDSHINDGDGSGGAACSNGKAEPEVVKNEILDHLTKNSKIIFKSQQIDDPELTTEEKKAIAENILKESHEKFLYRFGKYLQIEHLPYFENSNNPSENVNLLINDIRSNLKNHKMNVRNRRFAAMRKMLEGDVYFSEKEMMQREPYLYEKMVGKYLTDGEKYLRDRNECEGEVPFSNILLDGIDNEHLEKLRKEQAKADDSESEESSQQSSNFNSKPRDEFEYDEQLFPRKPAEFTKQWGGFVDDEKSQNSDAGPSKKHRKVEKFITAEEKGQLRKEFFNIMLGKFLDGDDVDFDYDKVDNDADLDDMEQIDQDKEDKYFDSDDDSDNQDDVIIGNATGNNCTDTSEDELDVYMRQLNRNVQNSMCE